jgi:energy-coupling factor transporter ATP-binding protein EcfA2
MHIRKFDPRHDIKAGRIHLFQGRRGSGKSTLLQDVAYYLRKVRYVVAFIGTTDSVEEWAEHIPRTFIHFGYRPEILSSFVAEMEAKREAGEPHSSLVLLEDCMYDSQIKKSPLMRKIFMNGRHIGMNILITMQYYASFGPELRTQVDYMYVPITPSLKTQIRLYDDYFGMMPSFKHFRKILMSCTQNWECLVLDNTKATYDISSMIYWYKATPGRDYRCGCKELWAYHFAFGGKRPGDDGLLAEDESKDGAKVVKVNQTLRDLGMDDGEDGDSEGSYSGSVSVGSYEDRVGEYMGDA